MTVRDRNSSEIVVRHVLTRSGLTALVSQHLDDVEQELAAQLLEFWQPRDLDGTSNERTCKFCQMLTTSIERSMEFAYLAKMMNYQIQSVLLHIGSLHPIGRLQNLDDVLKSDVRLEILLAERL